MTTWRVLRCRVFGHNFDSVELLIFAIKCDALNRDQLHPRITCRRCGEAFVPRHTSSVL